MSMTSDLNPLNRHTRECLGVVGRRRCRTLCLAAVLSAFAALVACSAEKAGTPGDGRLAGQVVVSGPLRKAAIAIDQIDLKAKSAVAIRAHVADATTDDDGRFDVQIGKFNGLFLLTASGGAFTDLATGATIQLDPTTCSPSPDRFPMTSMRLYLAARASRRSIGFRPRSAGMRRPQRKAASCMARRCSR